MSAPLVLEWSIHSRDALHALERLLAWLDPCGPIYERVWQALRLRCVVCGDLMMPNSGPCRMDHSQEEES